VALRHRAGRAWLRGKWQGIRQAGALRQKSEECPGRMLRENERTIYEVQKATGFDLFWRIYFLFAGGPPQ
jgi:hypothetical protein